MAHITADRVKDTTTTTGTGNITVSGSAPTGFRTLSAVATADNDTLFLAIVGGSEWEVCLATRVSANVYARTTILASSNSGSAVNFSAGTKDVFITLPASKIADNTAYASSWDGDTATAPSKNAVYDKIESFMLGSRVPTFERSRASGFIGLITPNQSNAPVDLGAGGIAATGTYTTRTVATTNMFTALPRLGVVGTTAANNQVRIGFAGTSRRFWRGNASGLGGFRVSIRFGISDASIAAAPLFAGLDSDGTPGWLPTSPLDKVNIICVGCEAADTTLSIFHNDGSGTATKVSLGANFPCNTTSVDVYTLYLFAGQNASTVDYIVVRENTGNVATGSLSTDLPASTTFMSPALSRNNLSTGLACAVDMFWIYGEPHL